MITWILYVTVFLLVSVFWFGFIGFIAMFDDPTFMGAWQVAWIIGELILVILFALLALGAWWMGAI